MRQRLGKTLAEVDNAIFARALEGSFCFIFQRRFSVPHNHNDRWNVLDL
jgi:hypothetical protein